MLVPTVRFACWGSSLMFLSHASSSLWCLHSFCSEAQFSSFSRWTGHSKTWIAMTFDPPLVTAASRSSQTIVRRLSQPRRGSHVASHVASRSSTTNATTNYGAKTMSTRLSPPQCWISYHHTDQVLKHQTSVRQSRPSTGTID
jgi:hypothetical protein